MTSQPTYLLQEKNEEGNWRTREVFFTDEAATRHKKQFHYRYAGETRVYVESNFENQEMIAVREFLMSLVDKEEAHNDGNS